MPLFFNNRTGCVMMCDNKPAKKPTENNLGSLGTLILK